MPLQAGQTELSIPDDVETVLRSQRQLSGEENVSLDEADTDKDKFN